MYFATPQEFRAWLERHGETRDELLVGYHRKVTGRPSLTWEESVDEALCFGWIDGIRRRVDDGRYSIRFTPRRPGSMWSARNLERVRILTGEGRMRPAGIRAFEGRRDDRSAIYSYEQRREARLARGFEARFRRDRDAWAYFSARPPSYRAAAIHWVMSAKREETRERRLAILVEDSAAGRPIKPLTPRARTSGA